MSIEDKLNKLLLGLEDFSKNTTSSDNLEDLSKRLLDGTNDLIKSHPDQKQKTFLKALIESNDFSIDQINDLREFSISPIRFEQEIESCQNKIFGLELSIPKIENNRDKLIQSLNNGVSRTQSLSIIEKNLVTAKHNLTQEKLKLERIKIKYGKSRIDELEQKLLHFNKTKFIYLTEDEDHSMHTALLQSNNVDFSCLKIISYKGIKNHLFHNSIDLIHHLSPWSKIIVHRDRDLLSQSEILKLEDEAKQLRFHLFLTDGYDLESHFISKEHLTEILPNLTKLEIEEIRNLAINSAKETSIKKIKNSKIETVNAEELFESDPNYYVYSKKALGALRSLLKERFSESIELVHPSSGLESELLSSLLRTNKFK
jgi:hypothetical protein